MKVKRADAVKVMVAIGFKAAEDYADDRLASKINKLDNLMTAENKPKDKATLDLAKKIVKAVKAGDEIEVEADKPAAKGKAGKVTNIAPAKGKGKAKPPADEDEEEDEEEEELDDEEEEEEDAEEEDEEDLDDEEDDEDSESEDEEEDDEDLEDEDDDLTEDEDEDSEEEQEDEDSDDEEEDSEAEDDEDSDEDDEESEEDSEDEDTDDEEDEVEVKTKKKPAAKPGKNGKPKAKAGAANFKGEGVINAIVEALQKATADKPISKKKIVEYVEKKCGSGNNGRQGTVDQQVPSRLRKEKGLNVVKVEGRGYYIAAGKPKAKKPAEDATPPAKKKAKK